MPQGQIADLVARVPVGRSVTVDSGHLVRATMPAIFNAELLNLG